MKGSLYIVPADDQRATELAMRDAARSRELWLRCKNTRQHFARSMLAEEARHLEERVIQTANALIERAKKGPAGA